ncbi:MAG: hypothetical protein IPP03_08010 [Dechloromonas sp.]|nr:hypothetical protein [Candidatus Dechloromonas phosphoritropha]
MARQKLDPHDINRVKTKNPASLRSDCPVCSGMRIQFGSESLSRFVGIRKPRPTRKEKRMKSSLMLIAGALMTFIFCLPALAQSAGDRELARTICQDQSGSAFNICVNQQLRNFDCTNAGNRQQCEARKRASRQCAGLFGWDFRQCTQRMIPAVDCSTSPANDRRQCELNQSAYVACSKKTGEDHLNCLRTHFSGQ